MKKIILISILMTNTIVLLSQNTKNDSISLKKNVVGIDMTYFLKQFLNFNTTNNSYYENPYMLIYKREFGKSALRTGIKFSHSDSKNIQNDTMGNINNRFSYLFGLGYERNIDFYKKWKLRFGIDGSWGYEKLEYKSQNNINNKYSQTAESIRYGISPFLSIGFEINSRFTLTTDTYINFSYVLGKSATTRTPYSPYDSKSKSNGFIIDYTYPTNLSLLIKF